jgi:hypothetical protein
MLGLLLLILAITLAPSLMLILIHITMVRPHSRLKNQLQRQVSANEVPYTVKRLQETSSETLGVDTSSQYESVGTRELNVHDSRQSSTRDPSGESVDRYLSAVCTADTDIEPTDRIQYDSRTFEVQSIDERPPSDPLILEVRFKQV